MSRDRRVKWSWNARQIDDDNQRDKRRDEKFDWHARRLGYHRLWVVLSLARPCRREATIIPEQAESSSMSEVTNLQIF